MRNYYYTAWESKEDRIARGWDKPSIQGWVVAKSIDDAERIIRSHGFIRDSLTFYKKSEIQRVSGTPNISVWTLI